jgi:intracellular sulfur oxidation DsrE/DsrF family protein
MNAQETFSEDLLHAFMDGELDHETTRLIRDTMKEDPVLRERVQSLMRTKEMMRLAFASAEPPGQRRLPASTGWRQPLTGLAASILVLALCFGAGVLGYRTAPLLETLAANAAPSPSSRLVLHIGESDPERFAATLAYAERYLAANQGNEAMVEVVANAGGIDLLRQGTSPYEQKITELISTYDNLHFVACMNTLRNLQRQGVAPDLIRDVRSDQTAVDHIVDRVMQGWTYVRVDQLPEI